MNGQNDPITDLDLMAYADDRLEPARRMLVELHLATAPADAAMVQAIREQNVALKEALDRIALEPVPPRLQAVLALEHEERGRPMAKVASLLALMAASGIAGWWAGGITAGGSSGTTPACLTASGPGSTGPTAGEPTAGADGQLGQAVVDEPARTSPPWFSDRVTLELRAPSLGASFASPELQRLVEIDGRPTVRFDLVGPEGRELALFLQTRPTQGAAVRLEDEPQGKTAYWRDGPLLWALRGTVEAGDLEALAERIAGAIELSPRLGAVDAEHTTLDAPTRMWSLDMPMGFQEASEASVVSPPPALVPSVGPLPIELAGG